MARRRTQTEILLDAFKTNLAHIRRRRGVSQEELAEKTGVPLTTIYRIEAGKQTNPRIRHLVNLAIALKVPLEAILQPEWKQWTAFSSAAKEPPDPAEFLGPWVAEEDEEEKK